MFCCANQATAYAKNLDFGFLFSFLVEKKEKKMRSYMIRSRGWIHTRIKKSKAFRKCKQKEKCADRHNINPNPKLFTQLSSAHDGRLVHVFRPAESTLDARKCPGTSVVQRPPGAWWRISRSAASPTATAAARLPASKSIWAAGVAR